MTVTIANIHQALQQYRQQQSWIYQFFARILGDYAAVVLANTMITASISESFPNPAANQTSLTAGQKNQLIKAFLQNQVSPTHRLFTLFNEISKQVVLNDGNDLFYDSHNFNPIDTFKDKVALALIACRDANFSSDFIFSVILNNEFNASKRWSIVKGILILAGQQQNGSATNNARFDFLGWLTNLIFIFFPIQSTSKNLTVEHLNLIASSKNPENMAEACQCLKQKSLLNNADFSSLLPKLKGADNVKSILENIVNNKMTFSNAQLELLEQHPSLAMTDTIRAISTAKLANQAEQTFNEVASTIKTKITNAQDADRTAYWTSFFSYLSAALLQLALAKNNTGNSLLTAPLFTRYIALIKDEINKAPSPSKIRFPYVSGLLTVFSQANLAPTDTQLDFIFYYPHIAALADICECLKQSQLLITNLDQLITIAKSNKSGETINNLQKLLRNMVSTNGVAVTDTIFSLLIEACKHDNDSCIQSTGSASAASKNSQVSDPDKKPILLQLLTLSSKNELNDSTLEKTIKNLPASDNSNSVAVDEQSNQAALKNFEVLPNREESNLSGSNGPGSNL